MSQTYNDEEQTQFIELAKEIGIGRAMRELGYPKHWATGRAWCEARGIKITVDSLKSAAAQAREWYKDEEVLTLAEAGMDRIYTDLQEKDLSADEIKKLSEAYKKFADTWFALKGKAQTVTENRTTSPIDLEVSQLVKELEAQNESIIMNGEKD